MKTAMQILRGVMMLHLTLNTNEPIRKELVSLTVAITLTLLAILPGTPLLRAAFSGQQVALLPSRFPVSVPPPSHFRSQVGLAKGRFLVASQQLRDPNFLETVVFLIDYHRQGAMGLVINRPTKVRLFTLFPEIEGLRERTDIVYIGGPVGRKQMRLLVRADSQPEKSHRVYEDIYISSSRTLLERMIDHADPRERFRVYAGSAGWFPRQLDREVSRGDWHVLKADAEMVFRKDPSEIWPELIRRASLRWVKAE
jgi:putative transcriptional regulator